MPLATKYRPERFKDVVGQPHITLVLGELLRRWHATELDLPPALLLSGPRGSGKTTSARIIANYLNCEGFSGEHFHAQMRVDYVQKRDEGITPQPTRTHEFQQSPKTPCFCDPPGSEEELCTRACFDRLVNRPCLECRFCNETARHTLDSIVEIDAASHGLVDDVRELAKISRLVHSGTYRVFIIDEAHAATREAFSALLKQLEEPLSSVLYILVTTDPQAIPPTIKSRCLSFTFTSIPQAASVKRLTEIAEIEGFSISEESLSKIALLAKGAMRDALMMMEHLSIVDDFSLERIETLWPDNLSEFANEFFSTAGNNDATKGIKSIRSYFLTHRNVSLLTDALIEKLSNEAILAQQKRSSIPARSIIRLMEKIWDARIRSRTDNLSDSILLEGLWHLCAKETSQRTLESFDVSQNGREETISTTSLVDFMKELQ